VAACIASILQNNRVEYFDVLIVSTEKMMSPDRIVRSYENNNRIRLRFEEFQLPSNLLFPLKSRFTLETYIRFWIGDFFQEHDRALYLDPDIIVTGSIAELWNTDLLGRAVGAVPIPGSTRPALIGMAPDALYFNAGVMLFDLNAWRRRQYCDLCLRCLKENPEKAIDADQDILNLCLANDWLSLPFRWNAITPFYLPWHDLQLTAAEIEEVRAEARIIHFNGTAKPWSYIGNHPLSEEYWKYLRLTEWRNARPSDYTLANICKKALALALPEPLKPVLRAIAAKMWVLIGLAVVGALVMSGAALA
jgi:lipopolysaccharide biosynthesis glycosyltransferase